MQGLTTIVSWVNKYTALQVMKKKKNLLWHGKKENWRANDKMKVNATNNPWRTSEMILNVDFKIR